MSNINKKSGFVSIWLIVLLVIIFFVLKYAFDFDVIVTFIKYINKDSLRDFDNKSFEYLKIAFNYIVSIFRKQ